MAQKRRIKVLLGKPGLDGHDRGAKVTALAMRDAGMEVIYTGLHRTVDEIISSAVQEDVDVIGLSILSGAHLAFSKQLIDKLEQKGLKDFLIVVGGVIPKKDVPILKSYGVKGVFPGGSSLDSIIDFIKTNVPV